MQKYEKSLIDLDIHQPEFASNPIAILIAEKCETKKRFADIIFYVAATSLQNLGSKSKQQLCKMRVAKFSWGFEYKMHKTIFLLVTW